MNAIDNTREGLGAPRARHIMTALVLAALAWLTLTSGRTSAQVVTADVRVAFAAPGATAIPELPVIAPTPSASSRFAASRNGAINSAEGSLTSLVTVAPLTVS